MSDRTATAADTRHRLALVVLGLAPLILIVVLIARYAVNVPVGDEWALVPLFEKWHSHQLTFADLYQQHNEHRIVVSKLIFLAFAQLTNWDLRAEMFFSVALCVLTSNALYMLLRQTFVGRGANVLPLWVFANLLLFSPVQAQNWSWGFQLQMFIPNLCLVATLVILSSQHWPTAAKLGISAILVTIATFSFANALLLWPILAFVLFIRGETKQSIASWLLISVVVIGLYLIGYYHVPAGQPVHAKWLDYPRYFLVFVGGAIVRGQSTAMIAAAAGLVIFICYFARLVRNRDGLRLAAPWLAVVLFVLGSALLTAYSRVNWRPKQALESRYATVSIYFYLALVVLALVGERHPRQGGALPFAHRKKALIALIVSLTIASWLKGAHEMARLRRERLIGLAAVEFSRVVDTTYFLRGYLRMAPGFVPSPVETITTAERLGLLHHAVRKTAVLDASNDASGSAVEAGGVEGVRIANDGAVRMNGWAILPRLGLPAPVVAVSCRADDHWLAVSLVEVGDARHDIATRVGARYRSSGWRATVAAQMLPPRTEALSAWAVDPLADSTSKLDGDFAPAPR